jgi:hypothetical protein
MGMEMGTDPEVSIGGIGATNQAMAESREDPRLRASGREHRPTRARKHRF